VQTAEVDHIICLGDVADDGAVENAREALGRMREAGVPVWVVPGNHDVAERSDMIGEAARSCEAVPAWESFANLSAAIAMTGVALVSSDGGGTCEAIDAKHPTRADEPALLVWASHYPAISLRSRFQARGLRYPGDLLNRRRLQDKVFTRRGPTVFLHGHLHASVCLTHGELLQVGCAPLVEWPHAWTLVTIDDAGGARPTVTVKTHALSSGAPPTADTRFMPSEMRWSFDGTQWVPAARVVDTRPTRRTAASEAYGR
jgi:calcineurin-like phosphoesterase family protein